MSLVIWWVGLILGVIGCFINLTAIQEHQEPFLHFVGWIFGTIISGFIFHWSYMYLTTVQ